MQNKQSQKSVYVQKNQQRHLPEIYQTVFPAIRFRQAYRVSLTLQYIFHCERNKNNTAWIIWLDNFCNSDALSIYFP